MTEKKLSSLELIKRDIIRQIEYDSIKIIRMKKKLKEIQQKLQEQND